MKSITKKILLGGVAIVAITGIFVSGAVFGSAYSADQLSAVNLTDFWRAWNLLNDNFISVKSNPTAKINDQEKIWGAISGLTDSFDDPYTVFLPPEENKLFEDDIRGNFGGIGAEIGQQDKVLTVIAPLPNTPAKKAGLESGDQILEINGQSTNKMSVVEAIKLIRGEVGTKVTLKILPKKQTVAREITITRAIIEVPTIETKKLANKIFYIKLIDFSAKAPRAFQQAMTEFVKQKTNRLILDLRDNPGGYLDAAIEVASYFLPKDAVVVIEERGANTANKIFRSKGYLNYSGSDKLKLVVLVDEGTASASEIVAGALKEHRVATLVGQKTFGKGSVQEVFSVTPETALKITVARWLTPHGLSISENGLTPDVVVESKTEPNEKDKDPQLEKALEIVRQLK